MPNATTFQVSKHLDEGELGPVEERCLFCDSPDRVPVTRLQAEPDVELLQCGSCGVCSASRIPTVAALKSYYAVYYEQAGCPGSESPRVTFQNTTRFARHLAEVLQAGLPLGSLDILDFGGGDGTIALALAERLQAAGYPDIEITVVEYQDEVLASSHEAIVLRHEADLDSVASRVGAFDVVIASAILEHLPDAKAETERLLDLVRPGGILYVRTPCVVPGLKLMERLGLNLDFTFPGHIHDMGQVFWEDYFVRLTPSGPHRILCSQPSMVETGLRHHFIRTCLAHLLKLPWRLLGRRYALVGGWEIFVQKTGNG